MTNGLSTAPPAAATHSPSAPVSTGSLAAVVLLAGSVRQTDISGIARRSLLDLPFHADNTLGTCWMDRIGQLRVHAGRPALKLLVTANSISGHPESVVENDNNIVRMDINEPRGSGGALRDALLGFDPNSHVLIAPGHALPRGNLSDLLALLAHPTADIVIHADAAKMPTGFLLLRCGVLANVAVNGFADLKEQVLPQLAKKFDVRVVREGHPSPLPVRSLAGYIQALRAACNPLGASPATAVEEWRSSFSISEDGAELHPTARLHDSVVLEGGRVGAGAIVVRCLVGPGGAVAAGEAVFDKLIGSKEV